MADIYDIEPGSSPFEPAYDSDRIDSDAEEKFHMFMDYNFLKEDNMINGKENETQLIKSNEEVSRNDVDDELEVKASKLNPNVENEEADSKYHIQSSKPKLNNFIDLTTEEIEDPENYISLDDSNSLEDGEIIDLSSDTEDLTKQLVGDLGFPKELLNNEILKGHKAIEIKRNGLTKKDFLDNSDNLKSNRYFSTGPSGSVGIKCFFCNGDHVIADCPVKKKACKKCGSLDHDVDSCTFTICFRCKKSGHTIKDCQEASNFRSCSLCGSPYHNKETCTQFWRKYILKVNLKQVTATKPYCAHCGECGHYATECSQTRVKIDSGFRDLRQILDDHDAHEVKIIGNYHPSRPSMHAYFKKIVNGTKPLSTHNVNFKKHFLVENVDRNESRSRRTAHKYGNKAHYREHYTSPGRMSSRDFDEKYRSWSPYSRHSNNWKRRGPPGGYNGNS